MSFLSTIEDIGSSAGEFFSGSSIASSLVKTVALAYVATQLSQSVNSSNATGTSTVDAGVKVQVNPALDNKIPVVYGTAFFGGDITEAVMSTDNKIMYYCVTLCEKTGTKLSDGQASTFTYKDIFWNDQRIVFHNDGITAAYIIDRSGVIDTSIDGLVQVYCYTGGSSAPVLPQGYSGPTYLAHNIIPGWALATHPMSDLVFAVIKVTYSSAKNITGLETMKFNIANSMTLPGDCLYDYMSNTRYGAGIPTTAILST